MPHQFYDFFLAIQISSHSSSFELSSPEEIENVIGINTSETIPITQLHFVYGYYFD